MARNRRPGDRGRRETRGKPRGGGLASPAAATVRMRAAPFGQDQGKRITGLITAPRSASAIASLMAAKG